MAEASKLLSREDESEWEKNQVKQKKLAEVDDELLRECTNAQDRMRQHKESQAASSGGKQSKAKKRPKQKIPTPEVLDHATAKALAPPNALSWRSFHGEAWCGRVSEDHSSVSRTWRKAGGPNQASHQVLVEVWKAYCKSEGLDPADCPLKGVYELASAQGSKQ